MAYHRVVHALPDLHDSDIALVISPLEHRPLPLIDTVVDQCGDHAALGVVLRGTHRADLDLAAGLLVVGHHVDWAHEAVRLPHGELRNDGPMKSFRVTREGHKSKPGVMGCNYSTCRGRRSSTQIKVHISIFGRGGTLTFAFSSVVKSRSPLWFQFKDVMGLRCVLPSSSEWRSSAFQKDIAP